MCWKVLSNYVLVRNGMRLYVKRWGEGTGRQQPPESAIRRCLGNDEQGGVGPSQTIACIARAGFGTRLCKESHPLLFR